MGLQKISILGVGLLGGSIGLAAKSVINGCKINGYGHRRATLDAALQKGAIDKAFDDPKSAVEGCDLVILCTPVGIFDTLVTAISPALNKDVLITDVGSTKRSIVNLYKSLPNPARFVGSHPMAGSEKRGVEFARSDLFQNALCLTTPTPETDPAAIKAVESFWQLLGMRIHRLTPDEHDLLLAQISHLPHAVAAALIAMQSAAGLKLAGKGFADTTRIAAGDPALWRDIFLDNRDNLSAGIDRLQSELATLKRLLEAGDEQAVKNWLAAAAGKRTADGGR